MNEDVRGYWNGRYRTCTIGESLCYAAPPRLLALIDRLQRRALRKALRASGFTAGRRFAVLDMGCGFADCAAFYHREFPQASYTGVDISDRAIAHGKQTWPDHDLFADDIVAWRHPANRRFDVVQSINVLQLLIDDVAFGAALANLVHHLTADGVILLPLAFSDVPAGNERHRIRSRASFDRLLAELGVMVAAEIRMFYWLIDGGPSNRWLRAVFARTGVYSLFVVDRIACALGLPNHDPEHHLSRANLLVIRRRPASDPRSGASGN